MELQAAVLAVLHVAERLYVLDSTHHDCRTERAHVRGASTGLGASAGLGASQSHSHSQLQLHPPHSGGDGGGSSCSGRVDDILLSFIPVEVWVRCILPNIHLGDWRPGHPNRHVATAPPWPLPLLWGPKPSATTWGPDAPDGVLTVDVLDALARAGLADDQRVRDRKLRAIRNLLHVIVPKYVA
jgi:hypothetical protein